MATKMNSNPPHNVHIMHEGFRVLIAISGLETDTGDIIYVVT